jgi:hypothetical protein
MSCLPLFQLWQHGSFTCRITPATEQPPYWVIVHEGDEAISQESFDTHEEAVAHAVAELRHATFSENPAE